MQTLMLQVQMLLAALSAFLPLVPEEMRSRAAGFLDLAAKALAAGGVVAVNLDDLAAKLAAVRAEIEEMVAAGRAVTPDELETAMARVRVASAAFRAALETAEGV